MSGVRRVAPGLGARGGRGGGAKPQRPRVLRSATPHVSELLAPVELHVGDVIKETLITFFLPFSVLAVFLLYGSDGVVARRLVEFSIPGVGQYVMSSMVWVVMVMSFMYPEDVSGSQYDRVLLVGMYVFRALTVGVKYGYRRPFVRRMMDNLASASPKVRTKALKLLEREQVFGGWAEMGARVVLDNMEDSSYQAGVSDPSTPVILRLRMGEDRQKWFRDMISLRPLRDAEPGPFSLAERVIRHISWRNGTVRAFSVSEPIHSMDGEHVAMPAGEYISAPLNLIMATLALRESRDMQKLLPRKERRFVYQTWLWVLAQAVLSLMQAALPVLGRWLAGLPIMGTSPAFLVTFILTTTATLLITFNFTSIFLLTAVLDVWRRRQIRLRLASLISPDIHVPAEEVGGEPMSWMSSRRLSLAVDTATSGMFSEGPPSFEMQDSPAEVVHVRSPPMVEEGAKSPPERGRLGDFYPSPKDQSPLIVVRSDRAASDDRARRPGATSALVRTHVTAGEIVPRSPGFSSVRSHEDLTRRRSEGGGGMQWGASAPAIAPLRSNVHTGTMGSVDELPHEEDEESGSEIGVLPADKSAVIHSIGSSDRLVGRPETGPKTGPGREGELGGHLAGSDGGGMADDSDGDGGDGGSDGGGGDVHEKGEGFAPTGLRHLVVPRQSSSTDRHGEGKFDPAMGSTPVPGSAKGGGGPAAWVHKKERAEVLQHVGAVVSMHHGDSGDHSTQTEESHKGEARPGASDPLPPEGRLNRKRKARAFDHLPFFLDLRIPGNSEAYSQLRHWTNLYGQTYMLRLGWAFAIIGFFLLGMSVTIVMQLVSTGGIDTAFVITALFDTFLTGICFIAFIVLAVSVNGLSLTESRYVSLQRIETATPGDEKVGSASVMSLAANLERLAHSFGRVSFSRIDSAMAALAAALDSEAGDSEAAVKIRLFGVAVSREIVRPVTAIVFAIVSVLLREVFVEFFL